MRQRSVCLPRLNFGFLSVIAVRHLRHFTKNPFLNSLCRYTCHRISGIGNLHQEQPGDHDDDDDDDDDLNCAKKDRPGLSIS
jgi:hypothetical protein